MNIPYIINIQKYSIHDGDGIRTTIFFKGCHLTCLWCHNPEGQSFSKEIMFNRSLCNGCGDCKDICSATYIENNISYIDRYKCDVCAKCLDFCVQNAREIAGKQYAIADLITEVEKDKMFYEETGGGITLSGGEVMSQDIEYLVELTKRLKKKGYNIAIDTCGYAPFESFEKIMPYVDTFLYDIKLIDAIKHKKYMGKDNVLILENLKKISQKGANLNIRIPVIGTVNEDDDSINGIINFLKQNINVSKINLLPYHNTGSSKYDKLDIQYKGSDFTTPSAERMNEISEKFKYNGYNIAT